MGSMCVPARCRSDSAKRGSTGAGLRRSPLVSAKNRRARVEFSLHEHTGAGLGSSGARSSSRMSESKFELWNGPGIRYVRRPLGKRFSPRYQRPTVKHGGASVMVMVWGAFSAQGVGPLYRIQGTMTADVYRRNILLRRTMLPYAQNNMPPDLIFQQQDNDPKHTAGTVRRWWFHHNEITVIKWPAQSPDLNPIEHLWGVLGRRCAGVRVRGAEAKYQLLEPMWHEIPQAMLDTLIDSMPRRMQAVIRTRGFPTKY